MGSQTIPVLDKLRQCVQVADDLMAYARHEDGKPRNAKLLLGASEHLRKSLETATRLYEALRQVDAVDRMHDAIMQEISAESPELAERIVLRLGQVVARFGAG